MIEEWKKWNIDDIPAERYELFEIQLNENGLTIILGSENIKLEIMYKETYLMFRCSDEGYRWKTVDAILNKEGGGFFKTNFFFKVENSEYKKWFINENFETWTETEFEHHAYVTDNDIVDVLARCEPVINVKRLH